MKLQKCTTISPSISSIPYKANTLWKVNTFASHDVIFRRNFAIFALPLHRARVNFAASVNASDSPRVSARAKSSRELSSGGRDAPQMTSAECRNWRVANREQYRAISDARRSTYGDAMSSARCWIAWQKGRA